MCIWYKCCRIQLGYNLLGLGYLITEIISGVAEPDGAYAF